MGRKAEDLTGQQFGLLQVIERDFSKKNTSWFCRCNCGNPSLISVQAGHLKDGHTKSCGCLNRKISSLVNSIDLVGQKYGLLTVIEKDKNISGKGCLWICKCECGNIVSVKGAKLRNGTTNSCGCLISKGEAKIAKILSELNIPYERQKTFSDLVGKNNVLLRFDFYLPLENLIIEYQGIQHYIPQEYFGGETRFKKQLDVDTQKKEYCKENFINFVEISYKDFDKIDSEYIQQIIKES